VINMGLSLNSSVILAPDLMFCDAGGEAVVFSEATGKYYGLNAVGMRLWRAFEADGSLARAHDTLLSEYEADPLELERDILAFVRDLARLELLSLRSEP
ncbi:MAG: PqqD family protein, partial [Actinomycetota bacterium]